MSYSQWINSRFYTYWDTAEYADMQQLRIDAGDVNALVSYDLVRSKPRELAQIFAKTHDELEELLAIFVRFCWDVENFHDSH